MKLLLRSLTHCKKFQEKPRDHIHDVICRPHLPKLSSMKVSNWYHIKIFAINIYKRVIARCASADVSDFKHSGVKMFLLNTWSEHQNLKNSRWKISSYFQNINNIELEFPQSEKLFQSGIHNPSLLSWKKIFNIFQKSWNFLMKSSPC